MDALATKSFVFQKFLSRLATTTPASGYATAEFSPTARPLHCMFKNSGREEMVGMHEDEVVRKSPQNQPLITHEG